MRPLLSLCIPTYNRSNLLREALKAITDQIDENIVNFVEIVISDNASCDGTKLVCSEYEEVFPKLLWKVVRQTVSVGADNVQIVSKYASGKYVWILSDDDIITQNSIQTILDKINKGYDVIVTNHNSFNTDVKIKTKRYFNATIDKEITATEDVLELLGSMISFLSIICFRKSLVDVHAYEFANGTNLPQSYMFVDAITEAKSFILVAEPLISTRLDNTGGYQVFAVFIENFMKLIYYSLDRGISQKSVERIKHMYLRKFLIPLIINLKTNGIGTLEPNWVECRSLLTKYYSQDILFNPVLIPLTLAPRQLLRTMIRVKTLIKKIIRRSQMNIANLRANGRIND